MPNHYAVHLKPIQNNIEKIKIKNYVQTPFKNKNNMDFAKFKKTK